MKLDVPTAGSALTAEAAAVWRRAGRPSALLRGGPVRTGSGRGPRLLFARGLANLAAAAFEHLRAGGPMPAPTSASPISRSSERAAAAT